MFSLNNLFILLSVLLMTSTASAFWWGTQDTQTLSPYYYHQRFLNSAPQYGPPPTQPDLQPVPLPSIPIQVPLQAQLAPAPNVHNVQLVPCLCPVSQDFDYEKAAQENGFYVNPSSQNQQKPKQP